MQGGQSDPTLAGVVELMDREKSAATVGVVAHLKHGDKGELLLVMDDVVLALESPERWEKVRLFTEKEMSEHQFMAMGLTDGQLADVGMMLVARLSAMVRHMG